MSDENKITENQVMDPSKAIEIKDVGEEEYSIYNYIKSHPGSIAIIFSSIVATITFFAQLAAYISNKNILEYWNIDNSYASWNPSGLLNSALISITYAIVVLLLTTWFSKTCEAYLEQKKLFITLKILFKKYKKQYKINFKTYKNNNSSSSSSEDDSILKTLKDDLVRQEKSLNKMKKIIRKIEYTARYKFFLNLMPNVILLIIFAVIWVCIVSTKNNMFISSIVILVIHLFMYWVSFLTMQHITIKKRRIRKNAEEITSEDIEILGDFKKEYPISSLLKRGDRISNFFIISQLAQTIIACLFLVFSLAIIGSSEGSKRTFQIVDIESQQYVVVYHENETYFLEKAMIDGDKLEVYCDEQRIVTTSDISFVVKTFAEVVKINAES